MDNAWSIRFDQPVSYEAGLLFQYRLLAARQAEKIPDTVVLLQHTPTVTLGNRGRDNYLLKSEQEYSDLGIDLFKVERGAMLRFTVRDNGFFILFYTWVATRRTRMAICLI